MVEKGAERAWRMGSDRPTTFRAWWEDSGNRDRSSHSARAQKIEAAVYFANDCKITVTRGTLNKVYFGE
jgi:hypothetical protein